MSSMRWKEIAETIRAQIVNGELAPGARLPGEQDLAAKWDVARMTVHRAMQELQREGWVTRQRRTGTVVAIPKPRPGRVALLYHNQHDYLELEYMRGIRTAIPDSTHLILCDTRALPEREAQYLLRMRDEADCILIFPTCVPENSALLQETVALGTPIVCLDRVPADIEIDAVVTDNYLSSLEALRFLIQRGHHRIAHLTSDETRVSAVKERGMAHRQALLEAGIVETEILVRHYPVREASQSDFLRQLIRDTLLAMRHDREPVTAVFCLNDYYLVTLMDVCDELNIAVPEEIEILSFADGLRLLPRQANLVHRIEQQAYRMGFMAAERLLTQAGPSPLPPEVQHVPAIFHFTPYLKDEQSIYATPLQAGI